MTKTCYTCCNSWYIKEMGNDMKRIESKSQIMCALESPVSSCCSPILRQFIRFLTCCYGYRIDISLGLSFAIHGTLNSSSWFQLLRSAASSRIKSYWASLWWHLASRHHHHIYMCYVSSHEQTLLHLSASPTPPCFKVCRDALTPTSLRWVTG